MRVLIQKHPVVILVGLAVMILLVWGFWPQAILVEVHTVKSGPMTLSIEEEGRTRVIDRYVVSAPVDGVACRVQLNVGDSVTKDQQLLSIAPLQSQVLDLRSRAQAKANAAAAESALSAAKEQVILAASEQQLMQKELERIKPLLDKNLISKDKFDKAETKLNSTSAALRSAKFNVEVVKYELEAAKMMLDYSLDSDTGQSPETVPVRSPIYGKILKVAHECEGPVRTGDPLLEIGDPSALEIEVDVLSADAVKIQPGMKVILERWGGDQALKAQVRVIEPIGTTKTSALGVEEQRVLVISDITSPSEQWERMGDGYRIEAKFILWHEERVLQVPESSLFRYQDGWALFVVENRRALLRQVEIGQRNGLSAQVLSGIKSGDQIVNHPNSDIDHNARVSGR